MKAISLKQPWANRVTRGEKTTETRKWSTAYRGPILIVSSKSPPIEPAGYAVAVATITDCRAMTREDEAAACCEIYPRAQAWILEDIRKLKKPFPVKGQLGIFEVEVTEEQIQ